MPRSKPKVSPRRVTLYAYTRFEERKVFVTLCPAGEKHVLQGGRVELEVYSTKGGVVRHRRTVRMGQGRPTEIELDMEKVPSGCCAIRGTFVDRHGTRCRTQILQQEHPGPYPWLRSTAGMSDTVPAPWSPLETKKTAAGVSVALWGRRYDFDGRSFVRSVRAAGKSILSGAVQVVGKVNGRAIRFRSGILESVAETEAQVVLDRSASGNEGLSFRSRTEIDFDGMIRVDWALTAARPVRLDELVLRVPVKAEHAGYLYTFPGKWGTATNARAMPRRGERFGFAPYVWMGDEERGVAWFAESDENWFKKDPDSVTRIIREGDAVTLDLHLVSRPINLVPGDSTGLKVTGFGQEADLPSPNSPIVTELRYTFGMQATPVKPVEETAWDHRIVCLGQESPALTGRLALSADALDSLVEAGVRTVVLFEFWTDAEGHTRTHYGRELQRIVKDCHDRGLNILLYFSFLISNIAPEWRDLGEHCVRQPRYGYPLYHYQPQPEQSAWVHCLNSEWQDFLVSGVTEVMDEFGVDGVYLDGTEYPFGCCNTFHGCGTQNADGSIAQTYPIFAVRSAMRRLYHAVRSRRPNGQLNVHNSTCMVMPTLGWATSYWDGEQFQNISRSADVGRLLPLDAFRAEFMGHQWGVPAEFLCYGNPFTYEQAWAVTLLHDVPVRPSGISIGADGDLGLISSIWEVMDAFGRGQAEWLPYWRNAEYARTSPKETYVSLYRHDRNGVLCVVSNLGRQREEVTLRLDLQSLGLAGGALKATNALTGRVVAVDRGTAKLDIKSLGWVLVWLKTA